MFRIGVPIVVCFILYAFLSGCAAAPVRLTADRIKSDMASIKNEIIQNRGAMNKLRIVRAGATGFYYVVDTEGTVVFHPQPAIIGTSFKNHWFINKIIADKTGCLSYTLGNRTHLIFFDRLNDSEILCLSILTDDLGAPPADCSQPEVK
jgi:hypothetical protein